DGGNQAGGLPGGGELPGGTQQGQSGELPGGGQMTPGGGNGELPGGGQPTGRSGELGGTSGQRAFGRGGMGGGPGGMGGADSGLISYLKNHQDGAKWLLAVSNSQSAAQIELSAKEPVISMWGFTGSDNAMTVAKLKELVKKGELHYIQIGSGGMGGGPGGGNNLSTEVSNWVKQHGTAVKESQYSKSSTSNSTSSTTSSTNSTSLYRLDPSDVS
ncbi:MAG: hypothetical protein HOY76_21915, partial [Streptomyces sp.]|nr:hypothetical protein [Streptomyces sp.]